MRELLEKAKACTLTRPEKAEAEAETAHPAEANGLRPRETLCELFH
jgi:hypothetical protein